MQLIRSSGPLTERQSQCNKKYQKVILQHNNGGPYVVVKVVMT